MMQNDPELLEEQYWEEQEKQLPPKEVHKLRIEFDEPLLISLPIREVVP